MHDNRLRLVECNAPSVDKLDINPYIESSIAADKSTVYPSPPPPGAGVEKGVDMSTMSREEIQALLAANKAEVSVVASELRRDMAEWREQNSNQLNQLTTLINGLSSKVDGKVDAIASKVDGVMVGIDGRLDGVQGRMDGIQGQMDGINTAISGLNTAINGVQSGLSTKLTIFGILITVVIALVGFGIAAASGSGEHSSQPPVIIQEPTPTPTAPPVVIQPPAHPDNQKK